MTEFSAREWFKNNRKTAIAVIASTSILLLCGITMIAYIGAAALIKQSEVYKDATKKAIADVRVIKELGAPVEPGFFTSGSIKIDGNYGNAHLIIQIKGSAQNGEIHVVANKSDGTWSYDLFEVVTKKSLKSINLNPGQTSP
jgi:hypothetical protein